MIGAIAIASPVLAASPELVPAPRELTAARGRAALSGSWSIRLESESDDDLYAAGLIADEAKERFGWSWTIADSSSSAAPPSSGNRRPRKGSGSRRSIVLGPLTLAPEDPALFREQGYVLCVARDSITIRAATANGRFYGAQTLRQMLRAARGRELGCVVLRDYPTLRWRGVSDDISSGQVSTAEDFQDIIRRLAYYKMNLYQPYIEDMYAFRADSAVGRGRGALDERELRAMVEEGRRNHVVVSPIFQTLGHQTRLLSRDATRPLAELQSLAVQRWSLRNAMPKLIDGARRLLWIPAEAEPLVPWSISPAVPDAYRYVKRLVDELAAICPAPFFHIGGDRAGDIGTGMSRNVVQQIGVGGVIAAWFTSLHDHLRERHATGTAVYSDALLEHREMLRLVPEDMVIVDWHYGPDDTLGSVRTLHAAGFRVVISPGLWSWSTFHPNYDRAFQNIAAFAEVGRRERALGCVVASWGEGDAENLRQNNWLGYAFAADAAWDTISASADEFVPRFVATEFGSGSSALAEAIRTVGWQHFEAAPTYARIFHRKPILRARGSVWRRRMESLDEDMQRARAQLASASVRVHEDELACLSHSARRFQFVADRELGLDLLARRMGPAPLSQLGEVEQQRAIELLDGLRERSVELTDEYRALWLERNKPQRLGAVLLRMKRQTVALDALLAQAKDGTLRVERLRISEPSTLERPPRDALPLGAGRWGRILR